MRKKHGVSTLPFSYLRHPFLPTYHLVYLSFLLPFSSLYLTSPFTFPSFHLLYLLKRFLSPSFPTPFFFFSSLSGAYFFNSTSNITSFFRFLISSLSFFFFPFYSFIFPFNIISFCRSLLFFS